uniref:Uncharacterized protein n=1 Tax=Arundo donax TaxID=35708 RepID=A0A0A9AS05_ARUDO
MGPRAPGEIARCSIP